jgi:hypothetical protein
MRRSAVIDSLAKCPKCTLWRSREAAFQTPTSFIGPRWRWELSPRFSSRYRQLNRRSLTTRPRAIFRRSCPGSWDDLRPVKHRDKDLPKPSLARSRKGTIQHDSRHYKYFGGLFRPPNFALPTTSTLLSIPTPIRFFLKDT